MIRYQAKAVVVGSGAGGAVAAAALAEAGIDTILLEQGRAYAPADHGDILSSMNRMYTNGGFTVTLGKPPIPLPTGEALGGTTIINSSTCFRPSPEKVASWRGPSWEALTPCFEEIEQRIHAHPVDEALLGGNGRVLKRGCKHLGIELKPLVHNIRNCIGAGRCAFGCQQGAKMSMDRTFIPAAEAAGARILPGHKVKRLHLRHGKISKITGSNDEGAFEVSADAVILAMGALATPAFLLKHRIANRSGRIGRGLCIHPATRVAAEFDEIIDGFNGLPQGAYIDHWADRGVMLEGVFTPPGPLAVSLPGAGPSLKHLIARYRYLSAFGVMVSDTATGKVGRRSLFNPLPVRYSLCNADAQSMQYGIARLSEIYLAAGAKQIFTSTASFPIIRHREDLTAFEGTAVRPSDFELMAFHPLGTCALGENPDVSVVDTTLQSHDVPGLYIMDASVIPSSLGVNPQVTIMGLALYAARLLAERLK